MRRVIVLGGFGFFGGVALDRLRIAGIQPLVGSRRSGADLVIDVENRDSIRKGLCPGDVVLDAVGPFQNRTPALLEAAIEIGFDLVDIADSLAYVRAVHAYQDQIAARGIRVYTACSTVSTLSAAAIHLSGIAEPVRISGFLLPATRFTAVEGTAASLFSSVGQPVEVFDEGRLITRPGWRSSRSFPLPAPLGKITAYLFESADSVTLPPLWPSLRTADYYVNSNVLGLNSLFHLAARFPRFRRFMGQHQRRGLALSRVLGRSTGGVGYEIEGPQGQIARISLIASEFGYVIPVAPAVLVAQSLAADRVAEHGLIPANRHVKPETLLDYLQQLGIRVMVEAPAERHP